MRPYEIGEHRHNFAVWAAARASQRGLGAGVRILRATLESCGIVDDLQGANLNEIDDERFKRMHRKWCLNAIDRLMEAGIQDVPFGRVAKLVAIYLKSAVILGRGLGTAFAQVAHPPIDGILLKNLVASPDVISVHKSAWRRIKWTKLNEESYYKLIQQLREVLGPEEPFWKLERFWTVTNDADSDW